MADAEDQNGLDDQQEKKSKKRMFNSGAADLEKVTDFEQEKEISKDISNVSSATNMRRFRTDLLFILGCKPFL